MPLQILLRRLLAGRVVKIVAVRSAHEVMTRALVLEWRSEEDELGFSIQGERCMVMGSGRYELLDWWAGSTQESCDTKVGG